MQGLHSKVLSFSRELQGFSQDLTKSVEELKRIARAKPCVGGESLQHHSCLVAAIPSDQRGTRAEILRSAGSP